MSAPIPARIELHRQSRTLELIYGTDDRHALSAELLRISSPSAEVRGHGPGQETLVTGKINVSIKQIRPVGHYAIQLVFSDGHDTGIYSWSMLWDLCQHQQQYWDDYLQRLQAAGATRDPDVQVVQLMNPGSR